MVARSRTSTRVAVDGHDVHTAQPDWGWAGPATACGRPPSWVARVVARVQGQHVPVGAVEPGQHEGIGACLQVRRAAVLRTRSAAIPSAFPAACRGPGTADRRVINPPEIRSTTKEVTHYFPKVRRLKVVDRFQTLACA